MNFNRKSGKGIPFSAILKSRQSRMSASYGSLPLAGGGEHRTASTRRRAMTAVVVTAAATLGCVAYMSGSQLQPTSELAAAAAASGAGRTTKLAGPGYVKWLKGMSGSYDYGMGKDYDDQFASQGMKHMDVTSMVPSALPGSKVVGEMNGDDFALDVSTGMAAPVSRDEINQLPMELQELAKKMEAEKEAVKDLSDYVNKHSLAQPESLVVHVGQRGPRGAKGARGPRGPTGDQGTKGETGPIGNIGAKGRVGAQGPQGVTGKKGDQGPEGREGFPGPPGARGAIGFEGAEGPPGLPGPDGRTGPPGMQGPNGGNGLEGETGLAGSQGQDGDTLTLTCAKVMDRTCFSGAHGGNTFEYAQTQCKNAGGTVMSFTSDEELKIGSSIFGVNPFWVGFQLKGNTWKFNNEQPEAFAKSIWQSGYPNSNGCAFVQNGKMQSAPCNENHPYLCVSILPPGATIV